GVLACSSMGDLAARCGVIFSAVTADQALVVAKEASTYLNPGALFVDVNSASPDTKAACAEFVEANQGRYVDVAIMGAVAGYGLRVPMLLGGPHAAECADLLSDWGMNATDASRKLGAVSAIKMCRSVVVKGLEALVIESFTAARAYGVEDAVVASLRQTFPGVDWE